MKIKLARFFTTIGIGALLIFLIVIISGGFRVQAGPFRLSVTRWLTPLLVAAAAAVGAAAQGRAAVSSAFAAVGDVLESRSHAAAIVLAAAAIGVGLGFGTYAASASDASGYVSQAALLASGRVSHDEPLVRRVGWRDAEWAFSPLGYRPGRSFGEIVPTYPVGLPLMMTAGALAHPEIGPFTIVPILAGLAVLSTYWLGRRLHSGVTGLVAAALLCTSPIFLFQAVQPMSDVPATALWAAAVLLATAPSGRAMLGAGLMSGLAVLTRPNLLPLAGLVAAVAVAGRPQGPWSWRGGRLVALASGAAPAVMVMLALQWRLYGSPFSNGYGDVRSLYSFSNISANATGYLWRLWRGEAPTVVLLGLSVLLVLARRGKWHDDRGLLRVAAIAGGAVGLVLACYLPYGVFEPWFYLRFLLPALPFMFLLTGALLVRAGRQLPPSARGLTVLALVVAAGSVNIVRAEREQVFNLRRFEARYRAAGRYLEATLPADAVVLAVQESGSAHHYARRPIVRWDWLQDDLEATLLTLRALGRHPVFLVEDWEAADLSTRFPTSETSRLDWLPRAEFGDEVRVRLFDPADRRSGTPGWPVDRVH